MKQMVGKGILSQRKEGKEREREAPFPRLVKTQVARQRLKEQVDSNPHMTRQSG